jgi:Holliday junction resolvase RusA-like endonuclease
MKWAVTVWGQPPTTNKMYSAKMRSVWRDGVRYNTPQMVKNKNVEDYQTKAVQQIRVAKPTGWKPTGQIRIKLKAFLSRNIDGDNLQKPLLDAVKVAIGLDDMMFLTCLISKEVVKNAYDARMEIEFDDDPTH